MSFWDQSKGFGPSLTKIGMEGCFGGLADVFFSFLENFNFTLYFEYLWDHFLDKILQGVKLKFSKMKIL